MATREVTLVVTIEDKDEWEGGAGRLPVPGETARTLSDTMSDVTRGDWELPWKVRQVREL